MGQKINWNYICKLSNYPPNPFVSCVLYGHTHINEEIHIFLKSNLDFQGYYIS